MNQIQKQQCGQQAFQDKYFYCSLGIWYPIWSALLHETKQLLQIVRNKDLQYTLHLLQNQSINLFPLKSVAFTHGLRNQKTGF